MIAGMLASFALVAALAACAGMILAGLLASASAGREWRDGRRSALLESAARARAHGADELALELERRALELSTLGDLPVARKRIRA